jgi:hypothetical protein
MPLTPEEIADGWIEWNGGDIRPDVGDAIVEFKNRLGDSAVSRPGFRYNSGWLFDEEPDLRVRAYRVLAPVRPITDEMVERAARAAYESWIEDARDLEPRWAQLSPSHVSRLLVTMRAALTAAMEGQQTGQMTGDGA